MELLAQHLLDISAFAIAHPLAACGVRVEQPPVGAGGPHQVRQLFDERVQAVNLWVHGPDPFYIPPGAEPRLWEEEGQLALGPTQYFLAWHGIGESQALGLTGLRRRPQHPLRNELAALRIECETAKAAHSANTVSPTA